MPSAFAARRLVHIAAVLARHGGGSAAARLPRRGPLRRLRPPRPGPERLRSLLEDLGGVFVKFGQVLALQPDILPLAYCNALFDLLDRMPPFPAAEVERIFREDFGRSPAEIFDRFEARPIAAASIAQVHAATLGGRRLAVKVQRPTTRRDFAPDLRLLGAARWFFARLAPRRWRWVGEMLREFIAWTESELDFRREASTMARLWRSARHEPRQRVPEVLWDLTSRRVLTAEFLDGPTLLELLRSRERGGDLERRLREKGFDERAFAGALVDNFLGDVFREGVFHADLHPANLLVLPENTAGYVDFGISGALSRYARSELLALALAYTRGDLDALYDAYLALSRVDDESDCAQLRRGLDELAEGWFESRDGGLRLRKSYTVVFLEITRLSRRARVWPQREVLSYFRSVITLDGLAKRFAPGFDVSERLEDFCARHLRERALARALSLSAALEGASAASRLATGGAQRLRRFLQTTVTGRTPDPPRRDSSPVLRAAVLCGGFACLLRWTPGVLPGLNPPSAEALLLLAALAALLARAVSGRRA
jgi:ubiquinone biosynthesis protein